MQPFQYIRPASLAEMVMAEREARSRDAAARTAYIAGGTTLVDLMKLNVEQPDRVVDLNAIAPAFSAITLDGSTLRLGAFAKMAAVADHPAVIGGFPVIAESLSLAASAQLRNMASLGGNVLQRTRCAYYGDPAWTACNKRAPGSGCAARDGVNRQHAVLGVSDHCIASYPGDFAQALMALDATVILVGAEGTRSVPFASLHREPGDTPDAETTLRPGEVITEFVVDGGPWARRSRYLKIRDRQSYEFAVASVAVALDLVGDTVRDVRIALGGVATVPWRAYDAETMLRGRSLDEAAAADAAELAFASAVSHTHNAFKIPLGRSAIVRALLETAAMEVRRD
ncbi:xanthine dehydrogenase family protein subunit M [Acuticoccus sp. M5D2P5]|uniref:FAD binding domain-containing protein n=1 Tax=Acuticoccus kalidii TaxID=2910977 RepID=UPI001F466A4A|nr:xanthine dehydrogenase family protein subunit M [Acuticoccus kalidii]MCF3933789.1 xanthine dehydrogenase family protein subunit M [Acuticoccus kalidii]